MAANGGRKSRTPAQQIGPILGIVIVCGIALALYAWNRSHSRPDFVIPTPTMPKINAHDYFVRAGDALQNYKAIGAVGSNPAGNGSLVRLNNAPLATLRQGLGYPCMEPPVRSFNTLLPYYAKFRALARLLRLESQVKSARGDWSGALSSDLDAIEMGEAIPHGGTVIGALVGIACQAIGRADAWKAVDHLGAVQARAAAARLERIQANHVDFADTLQEEKWANLAGLQELFQKLNWAHALMNSVNGSGNGAGATRFFSREHLTEAALEIQVSVIGKRTILRNYARYMDQDRANARLPYAAHPSRPSVPQDPINQFMSASWDQARLKDIDSETQNRLLLTALALRAYRVEHGAFPQTLEALVSSGYLKAVPADLFALQGPLRYTRTGSTYLLYSIGPDGIDDGGKPIDDPKAAAQSFNRNARYFVKEKSRGDIVAGKNLW